MKKNTVRTSTGGYATKRRAERCIERGIAVMRDGVLHMIEADHRFCSVRETAWVPPANVAPFVDVQDSGLSLFPHIGYDMRSKGRGRENEMERAA